MRTVRLNTPLAEADVRNLKLEDIVYISGRIFTARTAFHVRVINRNLVPPMDFSVHNVMAHSGPVMKKGSEGEWIVVNAGGTTSNRLERYGAAIIKKLGLRALCGKGTMGPETIKAMQECGAVHLCTNLDRMGFGPHIKKVMGVYNLEEMGQTEATWVFEVEDCGPFVVDIDAHGNNLFKNVHEKVIGKLFS